MAGGDGSLGAVAQVAIERELPFVCVPFGTRNHFARDLGLDRNDPIAALAASAPDASGGSTSVGSATASSSTTSPSASTRNSCTGASTTAAGATRSPGCARSGSRSRPPPASRSSLDGEPRGSAHRARREQRLRPRRLRPRRARAARRGKAPRVRRRGLAAARLGRTRRRELPARTVPAACARRSTASRSRSDSPVELAHRAARAAHPYAVSPVTHLPPRPSSRASGCSPSYPANSS